MSVQSAIAPKPSLTLKRRLNAPPEKVYAAWTEPKKIVKWFGPDAGPVKQATADVRVGGRYAVKFHTEDGEEHNVGGIYPRGRAEPETSVHLAYHARARVACDRPHQTRGHRLAPHSRPRAVL